MRARVLRGLATATVLAMLVPAGASADWSTVTVNNPSVSCDAPLPAAIVSGEIGSTVWVESEAQIDSITLSADGGIEVLDADWDRDSHEATIEVTAEVTAYVVWSCAPINGEPIQENDPQEV
jgi:hypothetical protein